MESAPAKVVKKRIRKPRGRGLRTNTGCLTCRTRHKKCDEQKPRCGPCTNSDRECVFPDASRAGTPASASATAVSATTASSSSRIQNILCSPHSAPPGPVAPTLDYDATDGPSPETHNILDPELVALYPDTRPQPPIPGLYSGSLQALPSVQSSETVTPDVNGDHASTKWLNLLATDAAQAGNGFSLPSSAQAGNGFSLPSSARSRLSRGSVSHFHDRTSTPTHLYSPHLTERQAWQADADIVLSKPEAALFRRFAERIAAPLDLFDPHKHFSHYATRLALRNVGLMKAILALSARYSSLSTPTPDGSVTEPLVDPNEAIQFYYETLHYVSTALQYNSYKHSEELLATAIVVSTYEMLDASEPNSNWQRHLKGVFWIQRSQDVNGASGGLRQAVWWAWLRQDLWAAFREHRRCFSFWQPIVDYPDLSEDDLAYRAVYLLSQAVNYCTEPPPDANAEADADVDLEQVRLRTERGNELMDMLERWRSFSNAAFKAFPTENRDEVHGWAPIWIHPPAFGVALQVYSFAKILVCLHRPVPSGFAGYRSFQKTLTDAVATICGIAMELTDPSCQIISAQCLFGAGLCVQDGAQQETIISLIRACEARTGWPMATMQEDLRKEWAKAAGEGKMAS